MVDILLLVDCAQVKMFFKPILLFLIFGTVIKLISAEISCTINPKTDDIFTVGDDTQIIKNQERAQFHISDYELKNGVRELGAYPRTVWVRIPTGRVDLYEQYGWQQVQRTYVPLYGEIVSKQMSTGVLVQEMCENYLSTPLECSITLTQTVTNTITHMRSQVHELTTGLDIGYKLNLGIDELNGKIALNYKTSWADSHTESSAVTLGSTAATKFTLAPGKKAIARLEAKKGTIRIRMHYAGTLSGMVTVDYGFSYQGHYYWAIDVNEILDALSRPRKIEAQEDILIEFYTEARIVVSEL